MIHRSLVCVHPFGSVSSLDDVRTCAHTQMQPHPECGQCTIRERRAVGTMDLHDWYEPSGVVLCPTGKRGYRDERTAVRALHAIQHRAAPDRKKKAVVEIAAYPCRSCPHWHLTSAPQTKRRTGAPRSRSRR